MDVGRKLAQWALAAGLGILAPGSDPFFGNQNAGHELPAAAQTPELRRGYRLAVVDVPPAPPGVDGANSDAEVPCPVEVRAIIGGDQDIFAILAGPGGSEIVRPGARISTAFGNATVRSVAPRHVTVSVLGSSVRCEMIQMR